MTVDALTALLVAVFTFAGASGQKSVESTVPKAWSPGLGFKSKADINKALGAPFEGGNSFVVLLPDRSKRLVKTCLEMLTVAGQQNIDIEDAMTGDWDLFWALDTDCVALQMMKSAKPAKRSYLDWFHFAPKQIAQLPPGMDITPSPDAQADVERDSKSCKPWGKYDPRLQVKVEAPGRASVRANGWTGELTLFGRGDYNDDGIEDLLLVRNGQVRGGTLKESALFLVSRMDPTSCARVIRRLVPGSE